MGGERNSKNSQVFLVLHIAEQKFFDLSMERFQPPLLLRVGEINAHISSWRHDVEFGIENINAMDDSVQSRKCKSGVTLILPNRVLAENI